MTNAQHTPGPWFVDPTGDIGFWFVGDRDGGIADCDPGDRDIYECEANARLIAAAPDLLEALRVTVDALNDIIERAEAGREFGSGFDFGAAARNVARAAIRKARGEE
jgi:hypothetical protein